MRQRSTSRAGAALACAALFVLPVAGCGAARSTKDAGEASVITVSPAGEADDAQDSERVRPSSCPAARHACRSVEGRIVYVESEDPDGDGDAHFVILDSQGITLPGLTAIDVSAGLRPRQLPGVGGLISAAGPLQSGSLGEQEIHALDLHVARR